MNQAVYGALLFVLVLAVLLCLNLFRQKLTIHLKEILYCRNDPQLYLQVLTTPHLKLIFRPVGILLLELDGWLYTGSENQIEALIHRLENCKMKPAEKLEFLQKKISYYVSAQKKEQAVSAYHELDAMIGKSGSEKYKKILREAELLIDVYLNRNTNLIGRLVAYSEQQNDSKGRGITQYRVAKLAYFKKDWKLMNQFLSLAQENLKGTPWQSIIELALKDNRILEVK